MPSGLFLGLATLDLLDLVPRPPHPDEERGPLDLRIVAGGPVGVPSFPRSARSGSHR